MDTTTAIERACEQAGGQAMLAKIIDVTPQAVNQWVRKGVAPPERVLAIESATGGAVTRYELRPDVFGAPPSKRRARAA